MTTRSKRWDEIGETRGKMGGVKFEPFLVGLCNGTSILSGHDCINLRIKQTIVSLNLSSPRPPVGRCVNSPNTCSPNKAGRL